MFVLSIDVQVRRYISAEWLSAEQGYAHWLNEVVGESRTPRFYWKKYISVSLGDIELKEGNDLYMNCSHGAEFSRRSGLLLRNISSIETARLWIFV